MNLAALPAAQLDALRDGLKDGIARRRLSHYKPYPKQIDFHTAGATHKERGLLAGNQDGKTTCAGAELAMHMTGRYPAWWKGKRYAEATDWWAGSETAETTRDNAQRMLMGRFNAIGTGMIPAECLKGLDKRQGVPEAIALAEIRHVSGKTSTLAFKSYDQGREKWQGESLSGGVWFDEEPPIDIYTEGITRLNATDGIALTTFTPLKGMSEVVDFFYPHPNTKDRHLTMMSIDDALHFTAAQRESIIAKYPPHEREARTKGIPMMGSGRIFPIPEENILVAPFKIPEHWAALGGMDFGWDHPFAGVKLVHDRDADCIYVTQEYRARETTPILHAASIKPWGDTLEWAWPHDGLQHDKGSGEQLASQYRKHGLLLLPEHAQFEDGTNGVEAGLMDMLTRMQTNRFKVFRHLEQWLAEFRTYHRKDGKVVKEKDDLMAATRYGVMCIRYAAPEVRATHFDDESDSWKVV